MVLTIRLRTVKVRLAAAVYDRNAGGKETHAAGDAEGPRARARLAPGNGLAAARGGERIVAGSAAVGRRPVHPVQLRLRAGAREPGRRDRGPPGTLPRSRRAAA